MCRERSRNRRRRACGMTLIELMIVVAVVALLGAVAYPAYQSSVRKAHRAEAKAVLTTGAQRLERHFTERSTYATATIGIGAGDIIPPYSENGRYRLSLTAAAGTPTEFTLLATPQDAQASDACGTFTINQNGRREVTGGSLAAADCW